MWPTWDNNRIQKFTSAGAYVTQWGSLGSGNGQFQQPGGIAVDNADNVYVADSGNNRIQKFTSAGVYVTQWGSLGSGNGQFDTPTASPSTAPAMSMWPTPRTSASRSSPPPALTSPSGAARAAAMGNSHSPYGIAADSAGNVYVADTDNNRIQKFTSAGAYVTQWGS